MLLILLHTITGKLETSNEAANFCPIMHGLEQGLIEKIKLIFKNSDKSSNSSSQGERLVRHITKADCSRSGDKKKSQQDEF